MSVLTNGIPLLISTDHSPVLVEVEVPYVAPSFGNMATLQSPKCEVQHTTYMHVHLKTTKLEKNTVSYLMHAVYICMHVNQGM